MANEYKGVSCIMPIVFVENLSTLGSEADIAPFGTAQAIGVVLPFDGSIVGLSASHTEATDEDIILSIQLSTTDVFEVTLAKATNSEVYARYMPDTYSITAGEEMTVRAKWASGSVGDDAGETLVTVWVQVGSSGT